MRIIDTYKQRGKTMDFGIFGLLIIILNILLPVVIGVIVIVVILWINKIKNNSELQVKQNKRILELLEQMSKKGQ